MSDRIDAFDFRVIDEFFVCECRSPEHVVQFQLTSYRANDRPDFEIHTLLYCYENIRRRAWNAVKYVFWRTPVYFNSCIIGKHDADRMIELMQKFKALTETAETAEPTESKT